MVGGCGPTFWARRSPRVGELDRVLSRQRSPTSPLLARWPTEISFARHQFPPNIIRHAVWLYIGFTLSFHDVEDLLAQRGLDVSYESRQTMGVEVRAVVRQGTSPQTSSTHLALASGRDGSSDRRQARSAGAKFM